jgi:O-antigen ligase
MTEYTSRFHRALLLTTVFIFFAFPIMTSLANVAMLALLLLWLATGTWEAKRTLVQNNPGLWFALGLYAWMFVGITYTDASGAEIGEHLRKYVKLLLMAAVVFALSDGLWRRRAWWAYGAAMAFALISTYLNIWIDLPWSVSQDQGWGVDHTVLKDYISQGILMSMFVAMGLANLIRPQTCMRQKWAWAAVVVLEVLSITHLSSGRSAYLALAAALVGFVFWSVEGWKRWVGMLVLAIGFSGAYISSPVMQQRIDLAVTEAKNHNLNDFSSIGQRMYFAQKSLQMIQEKPVLGWGTGAYHQEFCRRADSAEWCRVGHVHPHNQLLFIGVEHGLIGLALLLGLIFTPLWMTRHAPAHIRGLAAAYTGIFVVISMTHGSLWLSTESHFHTLMGALIFAGYKPSRST